MGEHKDQIERSLTNIAACIKILNDKIEQKQCRCGTSDSMIRIEQIIRGMQPQQTLDKQELKQQLTELKNINKVIPQG